MNLVPARIADGAVHLGETRIANAVNRKPGTVMLGMRADDLLPSSGPDGFELVVAYVEELGPSRLVHGNHAGVTMVAATPADFPLAERMRFSIRPELLHYFDLQSGQRT